MSHRLIVSLFAAAMLAACATEAPDPSDSAADAPPPALPESQAMMDEKASMEQAMSGEAQPMVAEGTMSSEEPMAAEPAPMAMSDSYTVYFAFNSAILSPEAESVIDEAASAAAMKGAGAIGITGYADTVGSRSQNDTMSRWRAQAVADEMVFRGIPATALDVNWLGAQGASGQDQSSRRVVIDIR